jgi:dTDP-4-dehydrorhamnose reductase
MILPHSTVLITGADGMLGRAFQSVLAREYPTTMVRACLREQLDVTDIDAVLAHRSQGCDLIIHCAAVVNADRCEEFSDRCHQVQVRGTQNILELAVETGAKVFYPQSFLIFSGGDDLIDEATVPAPQSVYGRCKLEAEQQIRSAQVESLVVRMAGFFGGEEKDKNFVGKFTRHLVTLLRDKVGSYAVGDRIWQPTYTVDLARNSLLLLDRGQTGVWSMACEGEASFREVASECVRLLGLEERIAIIPAAADFIAAADIAPRPCRAIMSNARLQAAGLCLQRHWRDALAEYLDQPWFHSLFRHL